MIDFCDGTSISRTINAFCLSRGMFIDFASTPSITWSIKERPSFKGDIRARTCFYIISHDLSSSTASVTCISCINAISTT